MMTCRRLCVVGLVLTAWCSWPWPARGEQSRRQSPQVKWFRVQNALTKVGDAVSLEVTTADRKDLALVIEEHVLAPQRARLPDLALAWKQGSGGEWLGAALFTPRRAGQL